MAEEGEAQQRAAGPEDRSEKKEPLRTTEEPTSNSNGIPDPSATEAELKKSRLSAQEVLKSTSLDDGGKFGAMRGLVEAGRLTNKEVVNSVLHLVSGKKTPRTMQCVPPQTRFDIFKSL